jgi:hypothetical protein
MATVYHTPGDDAGRHGPLRSRAIKKRQSTSPRADQLEFLDKNLKTVS